MSSETTLVEEDYESLEVLMVLRSVDDCEWIMNSGCSFHMTLTVCGFKSL